MTLSSSETTEKINGWANKSKVYGVAVEIAGRRVR